MYVLVCAANVCATNVCTSRRAGTIELFARASHADPAWTSDLDRAFFETSPNVCRWPFAQREKVRGCQIDSASEAANGSGCIVCAMPDMPMGHRADHGVARRRRQSRCERLRALITPSRWGAARPRREKKAHVDTKIPHMAGPTSCECGSWLRAVIARRLLQFGRRATTFAMEVSLRATAVHACKCARVPLEPCPEECFWQVA